HAIGRRDEPVGGLVPEAIVPPESAIDGDEEALDHALGDGPVALFEVGELDVDLLALVLLPPGDLGLLGRSAARATLGAPVLGRGQLAVLQELAGPVLAGRLSLHLALGGCFAVARRLACLAVGRRSRLIGLLGDRFGLLLLGGLALFRLGVLVLFLE